MTAVDLDALDAARAAGISAVRSMAFDWYCPWQSRLPRRKCSDCTAKVALDAAMNALRAAALTSEGERE